MLSVCKGGSYLACWEHSVLLLHWKCVDVICWVPSSLLTFNRICTRSACGCYWAMPTHVTAVTVNRNVL